MPVAAHPPAEYLPTRRSLVPVAIGALALSVFWFVVAAWPACSVGGCNSIAWLWLALVSLLLGFAFACFFAAVAASVECLRFLLRPQSVHRWPGPWPQPFTLALLAWAAHIVALVGVRLLFTYHGASPPFDTWYFGVPLLFK
jgi:hypothetical protein